MVGGGGEGRSVKTVFTAEAVLVGSYGVSWWGVGVPSLMMTTPSTIYPSCGGCVCVCARVWWWYIYLGSLFPFFLLSLYHPRPPLIVLQCKQSRRRCQSCWEFLPSTSRNCVATQGCWYTVILSFLVLSSLLTRTFSVTLLNLDITCYPHFLPLFFSHPLFPLLKSTS